MKQTQKTSKRKVNRVVGLGYLDFAFCIDLNDTDLTNFSIDINSINQLSDLEFISKNQLLMDKITITSQSSIINTLLYTNKSSKLKTFVEFTTFNNFNFNKGEEFFKEIVTYVTEHNFIFLNELNLSTSPSSVSFTVKRNGLLFKEFFFGVKSEQNNESEENNADSKQTQKKNKRVANDFPGMIQCDFIHFDYIFIDLNSILQFDSETDVSYVSVEELSLLLHHLTTNHPQVKTVISFPDIISNIHLINIDSLNYLNTILSHTDIFLFEKKEAIALFNLLNQLNDPNFKEIKGKIQDKKLEKLFFESFVSKRSRGPKLALFIEEFTKVIVIERSGGNILNNSYALEMHPRVNHTNQKLVEEYKKNIAVHKYLLKAVFLGGFLSKYISSFGLVNSIIAAIDITKRILEILRLDLEFPVEADFYIINIKRQGEQSNIVEKTKEDNFVLDCININKSKLNHYNPLKDNNLFSFFSSNVIRKHLKEVGFINTNGFILDDPSKLTANSPLREKQTYELEIEKEKKLLIAIKENEQRDKMSVRKNLSNKSKYLHDVGVKELEKLVRTNDFNAKSHAQLPSFDVKFSKLKPIKGYSSLITNKILEKVSLKNY
ncbi:MAG: hypothetical protein ACK5YA_00865 [bacterium]